MFKFNEENLKKAEQVLKNYPEGQERSGIMPLLWLAQEQDGENILSKEKIEYIADFLSLPIIKVYEVASFYTMYNLTEVGKNHIQVCGTVPCHLVGSRDLMDICKKFFGVDKDTVTSDGKFSYSEVECLGACANAPVVQINNKQYFQNLDKQKISVLIGKLSSGDSLENV